MAAKIAAANVILRPNLLFDYFTLLNTDRPLGRPVASDSIELG